MTHLALYLCVPSCFVFFQQINLSINYVSCMYWYTVYIKYLVTVLKYKPNLGGGKKTWQRARLAELFLTFSTQAQILLVFQDSYHVICLSCNIISYKLHLIEAYFVKFQCTSAVETMTALCKRSKKDDVTMHLNVGYLYKAYWFIGAFSWFIWLPL